VGSGKRDSGKRNLMIGNSKEVGRQSIKRNSNSGGSNGIGDGNKL